MREFEGVISLAAQTVSLHGRMDTFVLFSLSDISLVSSNISQGIHGFVTCHVKRGYNCRGMPSFNQFEYGGQEMTYPGKIVSPRKNFPR